MKVIPLNSDNIINKRCTIYRIVAIHLLVIPVSFLSTLKNLCFVFCLQELRAAGAVSKQIFKKT